MSVYIQDINRTDGPAYEMLKKVNTEVPILLLSRAESINFNSKIYELACKKFVCVDFIEGGWDAKLDKTLIVGENTFDYDYMKGDGWGEMHDFLSSNKPALYLKRELLLSDETDTIKPIEYPNWQPDYPLDLKEDFNNRPILAFNYWGRSHEARLILQGQFWKHAAIYGYSVCDNIYQLNDFMHHERNAKKLVSFHMPFYSRVPISEIMKINRMSKLSISLPGCGVKCFRSTGESIVNSVCVLPADNLAYSMPFIHGVNCIKFSTNNDVTGLKNEWDVMGVVEKALANQNLYDIYLESKKLADWYQIDNYINNYLQPLINNA